MLHSLNLFLGPFLLIGLSFTLQSKPETTHNLGESRSSCNAKVYYLIRHTYLVEVLCPSLMFKSNVHFCTKREHFGGKGGGGGYICHEYKVRIYLALAARDDSLCPNNEIV